MTDDELIGLLKAMEDRLMGCINGNQEVMLTAIRELRGDLRDLSSEHSVTRDLVGKLPGTVLGAIEQPLLRRMRGIEGRVEKLEKPYE